MTGTQVAALYKRYLQAHLRGMEQRGLLIYQRPIGDVLRACYFESSAFSKDRFAVTAFIQPLYQPASSLVLGWGDRLGLRNERWFNVSVESEEDVGRELLHLIQEQALPLFARFRDPADFVRNAPYMGWHTEGEYFLEAMGYSHAVCGMYDEGRAYLRRLISTLQESDDLRPYEHEMIRRNQQFDGKLRDRPEEAIADLRSWRQETLRAIRLNDDDPAHGSAPAAT